MLCIGHICSGAEGMTLGSVSLSRHMGQFFLNHAKLMQVFAHRFALGCIGCSQIKCIACPTDCSRAEFETANIEDVECNFVAFVDFAEQVLDRDLSIFKDDLASGGAFNTHFVLFRSS